MPSPFHQKYATQTHHYPASWAKDEQRRASDASTNSNTSSSADGMSPVGRRKSSTSHFAALEALKRPQDQEHIARRASMDEARMGKPGFLGSMWNRMVKGSQPMPGTAQREPRDITTLRSE